MGKHAEKTQEHSVVTFRPHRGSLADSMQEAAEVKSRAELVKHLERLYGDMAPARDIDAALTYEPYGNDKRVGWQETFIVKIDGKPVGFTNGWFASSSGVARLKEALAPFVIAIGTIEQKYRSAASGDVDLGKALPDSDPAGIQGLAIGDLRAARDAYMSVEG